MFTLCAKKSNGIRNALIPLAHRRDSVYLPKYNIVLLNKELCKSVSIPKCVIAQL